MKTASVTVRIAENAAGQMTQILKQGTCIRAHAPNMKIKSCTGATRGGLTWQRVEKTQRSYDGFTGT